MPKTKEELEQLKEDYKNLVAQASELSEEELENVTGGGCQTHSSETYRSLGIWPDTQNNQSFDYHPLIVTIWNSCKLHKGGSVCSNCDYCTGADGSPSLYCKARSKELDRA